MLLVEPATYDAGDRGRRTTFHTIIRRPMRDDVPSDRPATAAGCSGASTGSDGPMLRRVAHQTMDTEMRRLRLDLNLRIT